MIYYTKNEIQAKKARSRFDFLIKNQKTINLKEVKPVRTLSQNRYMHLLFGIFANETKQYTPDQVKQVIFKQVVNPSIFVKHLGKKGYIYLLSTSAVDTKQMTVAIENFRDWSSAECGIYLPAANEKEELAYLQSLIGV